jgi:hypothetical protein
VHEQAKQSTAWAYCRWASWVLQPAAGAAARRPRRRHYLNQQRHFLLSPVTACLSRTPLRAHGLQINTTASGVTPLQACATSRSKAMCTDVTQSADGVTPT